MARPGFQSPYRAGAGLPARIVRAADRGARATLCGLRGRCEFGPKRITAARLSRACNPAPAQGGRDGEH